MLSFNQRGIKCHFLSLWYDSIWDWTQVSKAIGEHSNHYTKVRYTGMDSILRIFLYSFFSIFSVLLLVISYQLFFLPLCLKPVILLFLFLSSFSFAFFNEPFFAIFLHLFLSLYLLTFSSSYISLLFFIPFSLSHVFYHIFFYYISIPWTIILSPSSVPDCSDSNLRILLLLLLLLL